MSHPEKVALITGGAKRIGRSISEFLHQQGLSIALHYHTAAAEAKTLADALNAKRKNSCTLICGNLSEIDTYPTLINTTLKQWGRLDILINNASSFYPTPFEEASLDNFDH